MQVIHKKIPNSYNNEVEYVSQPLKCSYNFHVDDCDANINLGLVDLSYLSVFNDFDETVTYDRDMLHGRIIDDLSMSEINSTTAGNHKSTLGTCINDLENDTGAYTNFTPTK